MNGFGAPFAGSPGEVAAHNSDTSRNAAESMHTNHKDDRRDMRQNSEQHTTEVQILTGKHW